jgi:hypothetical protein
MALASSWVLSGDRSCSPANGYPVVTRRDNWVILFRKVNTVGRFGTDVAQRYHQAGPSGCESPELQIMAVAGPRFEPAQ